MRAEALPSTSPWRRLQFGISNPALLLGGALVASLLVVAFLGPFAMSQEDLGIDRVQRFEGEFAAAPFPPSDQFPIGSDPLGRDILTTLVFGASQTLAIAAAVALVRLLLGMILGTLAGWHRNRLADRLVTGLVGYLAPFPTLILAMALIFALGIRRGQSSFVIALSLVGWTQIAQYVRTEVMSIKERPFIEGARAVGLSEISLLTRHVLPNIFPALIALATLEMAAALLILAELGFVGVFVGGDITLEPIEGSEAGYLISTFDAPEWGALLGSSWRYLRTATWVPFYPALAFFTAILAFNLLGMGLQTFFERTRINVASLSFGRFVLAVVLVFLGVRTVLANTGAEARLAQLAQLVDTDRAMEDLEFLTSRDLDGRAVGSRGSREAADYIAGQFRDAGLQRISALEGEGYVQRYTRKRVDALGVPELALVDGSGEALQILRHRVDFAEKGYSGGGEAEGELVVVDFWRRAPIGIERVEPLRLDPTGKVLLIVSEDLTLWPWELQSSANPAALLTVVPDDYPVHQNQPSLFHDREPFNDVPDRQWDGPWLNVTEGAADRLLESTGWTVATLRQALHEDPAPFFETSLRMRVRHPIETLPEVDATNVIGVLPGLDFNLRRQYVVLAAHYSGPGRDHGGTLYPAANENASGVAILLEIARLWQDQGFEPRRTVVFVAWDERGSRHYSSHPTSSAFRPGDVLAMIQLEGLGRGDASLSMDEGADLTLLEVAQSAAARMGVPIRLSRQMPTPYFRPQDYPLLILTREGNEATDLTPFDTLEGIDPDRLGSAGQVAALLAMILSTR